MATIGICKFGPSGSPEGPCALLRPSFAARSADLRSIGRARRRSGRPDREVARTFPRPGGGATGAGRGEFPLQEHLQWDGRHTERTLEAGRNTSFAMSISRRVAPAPGISSLPAPD